MSLLLVGDPHVTASEIADAQALIDGIKELPYDKIVFLGDLFHKHDVLELSVVTFWRRAMGELCALGKQVYVVLGNHDMAANGKGGHALNTIRDIVQASRGRIIDRPTCIAGEPYVGVPYCHHEADFLAAVEEARKLVGDQYFDRYTLLCHQTFNGAQYENGFYAPDGFDLEAVPFKRVISGHIHMAQSLGGRLQYIGSPRWRTRSDANEAKFILGRDDKSEDQASVIYGTAKWCRPIEVIEDGQPRQWENSRLTVIVRGSPEHVRARTAELAATGAAVLPRPTVSAAPRVSESQGSVAASFKQFLLTFKAPNGTSGDKLADLGCRSLT